MFVVPRCDLFIGVSGMSRRAAMKARRKFGARVWIERGSRHILSQAEILSRIAQDDRGATRVSQAAIRREIADYAVADRIVVPSRHVEESFLAEGTPPATLFRNPYGVDLRAFGPTQAPAPDSPVILMVGAWSLRKGADVLVEAWRSLQGVRLIHVGPVVDLPLPAIEGFEHVPPVPQSRLREFYGMASVFALASREEGLALVQAQALACGLRLVCTTRTGGEDLRDLLGVPDVVFVSAADAAQEFAANLRRALDAARADNGLREPLGAARERLSWKAYGERYGLEIDRDLGGVAKGLKPASVSSIPESFRTPA
jgi:glycosyltransferase involved in cell wall biosynthesis